MGIGVLWCGLLESNSLWGVMAKLLIGSLLECNGLLECFIVLGCTRI